jgi:hypothetical protein
VNDCERTVKFKLQMNNFCDLCNERVNFSSNIKLVEHYRGKKHRNNLIKSGREPNPDEIMAQNMTKKEFEILTMPRQDVREYVPLRLYAQNGDKRYNIVADRGIQGKVVGK